MGFLFMTFLEKDLEEIIYTSGRDVLNEKGLFVEGKLVRQFNLGHYGIIDLISITRPRYYGRERDKIDKGRITIFELKKDKIGIGAFMQAIRYARCIQLHLEKKGKLYLYDLGITLIGNEIDKTGSFVFLPDLISSEDFQLNFYTYEMNIDGLLFKNQHGYRLPKKPTF